jgi:hypothetical protein
MIKIKNIRKGGSLFHYAHFMCDCLFPEIVNNAHNYKTIIREKNIHQTLGNFTNIYEDVMKNKNIELHSDEFKNLNNKIISFKPKEKYTNIKYFNKFRNFIFKRYNIDHLKFDKNYPEVVLIKRGGRINLIDDADLVKINKNISTGAERREIKDIDKLELYLKKKYKNKFKAFFLEKIPFVD